MTNTSDQSDEQIKKPTFFSLLTDLEKADSGLVAYDREQHREILTQSEMKVDALKYIDMKFDSRIAEVDKDIKELMAIKKSLTNAQDEFRENVLWVMNAKGLTKHPGIKWRVQKTVSERTTVCEADSKLYLEFPELIKREYVWDKNKAKAAYKKDPKSLEKYIKIDTTESIKFTLIKGLDE